MALSLRAMRINLNKSADEVADYVGVAKKTIYKWENDTQTLYKAKLENVLKLCKLYGISVNDL